MRQVFLRNPAWALFLISGLLIAQDVPSQAEQDDMITAMRNYAADYTDKLPNFICQEVVAQFQAGRKPTHWKQGDTLTSKLVYNNGREERQLLQVNGSAVSNYHRGWRKPLSTEGEFGGWLNNIFAPQSQAKYTWGGWEEIGGKRLAKLNYVISREHSSRILTRGDLAKEVVGYHGTVWGDPQTGEVWRIQEELDDIPKSLETRSSVLSVDYGSVLIGGKPYLLPVSAQVQMATETENIRNEMRFEGYRKFEAESTISFGDGSSAPNH